MEIVDFDSWPKTLEIKVTQDDIDNGIEKSCSSCPIALAANTVSVKLGYLARATHGFIRFLKPIEGGEISIKYWFLLEGREQIGWSEADKFIEEFDNGREVKPFTFTVYKGD